MQQYNPVVEATVVVARSAAQTVSRLPEISPGSLIAGGMGLIAAVIGAEQAVLMVYLLVLMGVDLAGGLLRALILTDEEVDWRRFMGGILGKFMLLLLLPVAQSVDHVVGSNPIVVKAVLVGLMMHEGSSIVQNVIRVKGGIEVAMELLRLTDRVRKFPDPVPHRRHYDEDEQPEEEREP